eukprot:gene15105-22016_t
MPKAAPSHHSRFSDGISAQVAERVKALDFFSSLRSSRLPSVAEAVIAALRGGAGKFWVCSVCEEGSNTTKAEHEKNCHPGKASVRRNMTAEWLLQQVPDACPAPSVALYCQHSPLCYEGNSRMRECASVGTDPQKDAALAPFLKYEMLLHLELLGLQPYAGFCYRAVTFVANTLWDYRPGNFVRWD